MELNCLKSTLLTLTLRIIVIAVPREDSQEMMRCLRTTVKMVQQTLRVVMKIVKRATRSATLITSIETIGTYLRMCSVNFKQTLSLEV